MVRPHGPKYGKRAYSNIKWTYNFDLLRKILIIACILISTGLGLTSRKDPVKESHVTSNQNKELKFEDIQSIERKNELKALEGILKSIQDQQKQPSQQFHVWNENGRVHASNANYPVNNGTVRTIEEATSSATETKYIKKGNSIILPVVIGNNGKAIQLNMLLDTGCSITTIDSDVSYTLNIQPTGINNVTIADGSKIASSTGKVDLFQVGPFRETEFLVHAMPVKGHNKTEHGLLGMNFLEKHPFTIDHRRQVVMWR